MLNAKQAIGQDNHQDGQIDRRTGEEDCKSFLPFPENMYIFMIADLSILCVGKWSFGYNFQLENETQSTTDS